MSRRPFNPDRAGNSKPTKTTHQRVGFTERLEAVYGTVLEDVLTPEVRNTLVPAYYKTGYGITTSNSEAGVIGDQSGDALTSALGILDDTVAAWRWDGFSVKLPAGLETTVEVISDFINTITGFLEAVKAVLQVIASFNVGLGDALKVLVDSLKARIDEILGLFTGDTGIYAINIPLSSPSDARVAEKVEFLKSATSTIKLSVSKALSGVNVSSSSIAGRATLAMLPSQVDLPQSIGGTQGFINTLEASLIDKGDLNRPQLGPNAWVGGYVIMYGGSDLIALKKIIDKIARLFDKVRIDTSKAFPPRPTGLTLEVLSPKVTSNSSGSPRVAVRWDRPKLKFSLSNFFPHWEPLLDVIYRIRDPYSVPVSQRYDNALVYSSFHTGNEDKYLDSTVIASYDANMYPQYHIDEDFTPEDLGRIYTYKVGRYYRRRTGPSTYDNGRVLLVSAESSVLLPTEPSSSRSFAPDWTSASIGDFLPAALIDLLNSLREVIFNILDVLTDIPNLLAELIQNIIDEIQKWIDLSKKLQSILALIKSLLDIGYGAWAMGFFGLGGNKFLMDTLKSSIDNPPKNAGKTSQASPPASQTLSDFVTNTEVRFDNATWTDFTAASVVPDFGPSDSVGGFVLMAGDESMQAVLQTFKILKTLFGGGEKEESAAAKSYQVDQLLGVSAVPDYSADIDAILGPAPVEAKKTLFTEDLSGTSDASQASDKC